MSNFLLPSLFRWTVWATSYRRSMGLRTKTTKKPRYNYLYHLHHNAVKVREYLICDFLSNFISSFQPSDDENSDNSNECVVCLSDLRDTLILPCRHLCLCNSCADTLRYQANNCPICRLRKNIILIINPFKKLHWCYLKTVFNLALMCCCYQPSEPCCRSELWGKSLALSPPCPSALFWLRLWTTRSTQ